ncbi:MAG: S1C family serine protease [Gemmataceae bacterium]
MRRHSTVSGPLVIVAFFLLSVFLGGVSVLWAMNGYQSRPAVVNDPTAQPRPILPRSAPDNDEREAIDLFKDTRESVVNIDTIYRVRTVDMRITEKQAGTGSGFLWDDEGRIVTNFHVIQEAIENRLKLRVVLADRSQHEARLVGIAPDYDLAVLKIELPKAASRKIKVGTSRDLEVGQRVYAIGNPFGLSLTLTKGIISALDREITSPSDRTITGGIQIDAPINPGNSGGPLLDKDGRLIGVNTTIKTTSGGNIGIGFAIPVDTVNTVVPELIRNGKVLKPDMGVRLVEERRVRRAGFANGVMIAEVLPDGPAAKAGLKGLRKDERTGEIIPGDRILAIDGNGVRGNADFARVLATKKIGQEISLTIDREEETIEITLTLRGN